MIPPESKTEGTYGKGRRGTWESPRTPSRDGTRVQAQVSTEGCVGFGAPQYEL
jgi:hypothetical protein